MQEEGEAVFAPDGDSAFSGCAIMVMQQYNGATSSDLSMFSENPEILEALLQSYMESSVEKISPEIWNLRSVKISLWNGDQDEHGKRRY